ncbi:uncharacterized protein BXZ73DRAFT_89899 [Epithele typhae]|uniref:uncharacterized protein n=1 Tax=Epithele typhae TaxID=378194 RepID=UPI0020076A14|nr:uncharacterized protein BXZ73DRAFT_89899 [Epithele typhae]KAH9932743.1 hypothetical protein BXZ73DRAFT_89899 [Epithele typhae]
MDPSYQRKKIVDLSDTELITLGFLGEDVAPSVKRIVDQVKANPDHLGTVTCFMVDLFKRKYPVKVPPQDATHLPVSPVSPVSPTSSIPSEAQTLRPILGDDSVARTVVAPDLISQYEMRFWYHGISGDPPKLMWRSDLETNPFPLPQPGSNFFTIPAKTAHGVFNTPLNHVWHDVAPRIIASMKARGLKYSAVKTARFSTVGDDMHKTFGPIVLWIAVQPETTNSRAVRDATPDILRILADVQITNVVVEWYDGEVVDLVKPPPSLMSVEHETSPIFGLNHPFNTGLGIPIARQSDDAQGTLTLLFKEMKTSSGDPSDRILALTNKHVASVDMHSDYEFDGTNPQHILVCSDRHLDEAITAIENALLMGLRELVRLVRQVKDQQSKLGTSKENDMILRRIMYALEHKIEDIAALQTFLEEVNADWRDTDGRKLGIVDWAPKVSVSVDYPHYTRDIATFVVDREKVKNFESNIVDLGNQYDSTMLGRRMRWRIPDDLQLPIRRVLPRHLAINPGNKYAGGSIVGKYGNATKLTLGSYSGMEAYLCTALGLESRAVPVYNSGLDFAAPGDSGSLIFTGDGDALALLCSGMPRGAHNHVTFGTPMWWVIKQILERYPSAEFHGMTYDID